MTPSILVFSYFLYGISYILGVHYSRVEALIGELYVLAGARQNDLVEARRRDQLALARGLLSKRAPLLVHAARSARARPDLRAASSNLELLLNQLANALQLLTGAARGAALPTDAAALDGPGELARLIAELEHLVLSLEPRTFQAAQVRLSQSSLEL